MTHTTCLTDPARSPFWSEFSFRIKTFMKTNSKYLFKLIISHPENSISYYKSLFIYVDFNKERISQSRPHNDHAWWEGEELNDC